MVNGLKLMDTKIDLPITGVSRGKRGPTIPPNQTTPLAKWSHLPDGENIDEIRKHMYPAGV